MPSKNPYLEATRRLRPILAPPPKLSISQWAEKYRFLSSESSAKPGKYHVRLAPYQREPMDAGNDPTVQSVDLMFAAQTGKTTILENIVGYFIDADPSPILWVEPTQDMVADYSKERLAPMIRDTPRLQGRVKDARTRDSGNTIGMKLFPGGSIAMEGANSPTGLAGRPRRVVLMDEIDRYPPSAGTEGDPCSLAERRTESYWNAVVYRMSTPTIRKASRIESAYELTDKRMWFCPCPKCGAHQVLMWRHVLWGKKRVDDLVAHGFLDVEEAQKQFAVIPLDGSDAVYACEHCHAHLSDTERLQMVRAGEWRATAPFNGKRGYWLNGINSPFRARKGYKNRLHQMVAQFLESKGKGPKALQVWTNTFLSETWVEENTERPNKDPIMERLEKYTPQTLPNEVLVLLASVDVQDRWLQVEVAGVGLGDETWGVETKMLEGDPEQDDIWDELTHMLSADYKRQDGLVLKVTATAIDMRHKGGRVRNWIRHCGLGRVYPVFGTGGEHTLLVTTRYSKHYGLRTYAVDTKMGKDTIFARLKIKEPGPRYLHWPRGQGYNEEYFEQLTAEALKPKWKDGFVTYHYEKVRERNEALDIRVYLLAAVDILKPNLSVISRRLKPPPPGGEPPPAPPVPPIPETPTGPDGPQVTVSSPHRPGARPRQRIRVGGFGGFGPSWKP